MRRKNISFVALCVLALTVPVSCGRTQLPLPFSSGLSDNPAASESQPVAQCDLASHRRKIGDEIQEAERTLQSARETEQEDDSKRSARQIQLLKQIDVVMAQRMAADANHEDSVTRREDLQNELRSVQTGGPAEEMPYSFLLLDHLEGELHSEQSRQTMVDAAVANASGEVRRARLVLDEKQSALRQANEAAVTKKNPSRTAQLGRTVRVAELEVRHASEMLALRKQERTNEELAKETHKIRLALLEEKIDWITPHVEFSDEYLQDQLLEIDKRESDRKRFLESAQYSLQYIEQQWFNARAQVDTADEDVPALVEDVEAKRLGRQMRQQQIAVINLQLQRLGSVRETWIRRYKAITRAADVDELIAWRGETRTYLDQLTRETKLQNLRSDELRKDIVTLDERLQVTGDEDDKVRRRINEQKKNLQKLIQIYDTNIVSIESSRRIHEKLLREINGDVHHWTIIDWAAGIWHYVVRLWNMEITKTDERSITAGKILISIFLLYMGFVLSRFVSRAFGQRLLRRFGMTESGAAALQSVSFYVLVVICALIALRFANVPLTLFTFLGGAFAIGLGFGSQNIVNNFISGLILFAERQIRVGDLIQLDDLYGTVENIGARSTRIRTGSNLEIIVPNSSFLETNVLNLTLGDNRIRTHVCVGVVYGSPTRPVSELLKQAAEENRRVLRDPEPFVWFVDFGDNALNFELYFWVEVRSVAERKRIESEIRFQVDDLFREAGIVIAFPQSDVHVDSRSPVEIRLVADPKQESPQSTGIAGAPVSGTIPDSLGGWMGTGQSSPEPSS